MSFDAVGLRSCGAPVDPEPEAADEALARAAADGDRAAFATLIDRHYDRAFRVALGVLGAATDAEDVAQDVWTAMPRRLKSWRGEARFTTWLHQVALNAARDALRRRAAQDRLAIAAAAMDALDRGAQRDTDARLAWLEEALAALPDDLRETAGLVLGEALTHAAAARLLGVAEATVSWRMSEIRKRLRSRRAADGEDAP